LTLIHSFIHFTQVKTTATKITIKTRAKKKTQKKTQHMQ